MEIPNVSDLALGGMEDSGDDADLEAELLAITGGKKTHGAKRGETNIKTITFLKYDIFYGMNTKIYCQSIFHQNVKNLHRFV